MRQRCSTAAAMMVVLLPVLGLAQEPVSRESVEETVALPTRDGYKAKTPRRMANEKLHARRFGHGVVIPRNRSIDLYQNIARGDDNDKGAEQLIAEGRCRSGAVVIATVVSQRPVLAQGENFIFTDYKLEVNEAVKGPLSAGERFVLTRIGGEIVLPDEKIGYWVANEEPLVVGAKYLLFLKPLPESGDWSADSYLTYEVKPRGGLRPLVEGMRPLRAEQAVAAMATARQAECR